jgi:hypothetical protein
MMLTIPKWGLWLMLIASAVGTILLSIQLGFTPWRV